MTEALLNYAIEALQSDPDFYVPVKKLWRGLQGAGRAGSLNYDAFLALLQADARFEVEPAMEESLDQPPPWGPEEEPEMEALGFYVGPRAKLAARAMTAADFAAILERKTRDMMEALENAWQARPQDDQEAEDLLLEALASAQRLRRETLDAFDEVIQQEASAHQKTNPPPDQA